MPKPRYVFSLFNVNIAKIDQQYGIGGSNSQPIDELARPGWSGSAAGMTGVSKIDDLELIKETPEVISFLDESKRLHKCTVTMVDFAHPNRGPTGYKCFWDRNNIPHNVQPIGCPIRYVPHRATKSYLSEISKETYSISEPVTGTRAKQIITKNDPRFHLDKKGYYETDGIFCSFNCCMSYIEAPENRHNPLYRHSQQLLLQMYRDIHETKEVVEIIPAPHWRMLTDFGGTLSIEQFRQSFNKVEYIDHGLYICRSVSRLFEDKLKF